MAFQPKGIVIPVITPMRSNGEFKEAVYRDLIEFWSANGITGVFPFGTTGEFYAFNEDEYRRVLEVTIDAVRGRMTVYAGANDITTRGVIRLARIAEEVGADALSVLTPMFISQTQDELYEYYRCVAENTSLPIIIYNNRPKTNITVAPETVARLAEIPNIVGIKDSTGDMTTTEEYLRLTRNRDDFSVLMGRDTMILAGLHYGATGAIASCANVIPGTAMEIYNNFLRGDYAAALDAQFRLSELRIAMGLGSFPVVVKEALCLIGFDVGGCVPPIQPLSEDKRAMLVNTLRSIGALKGEAAGK